ncbi:MAG: hypothetical protein GX246_07320 [Clostridiales bacterium]|jgi:hypothetical protein|nr:hypothetical protein [Bacillota bacterium]NLL54943.1 hypothetical protein [Clostridiales bacterium]
MRKWGVSLLCLVIMVALAGCRSAGNSSGRVGTQTAGVNDVLEAGIAEEDRSVSYGDSPSEKIPPEEPSVAQQSSTGQGEPGYIPAMDPGAMDNGAEDIDVDLTVLSSTMVYSEVYNMMVSPENYIGKTVKMKGTFDFYYDEETDHLYFACVVQDATACCAQGIEFVLTEDYTFPDDYPEVEDEICVVGVFNTYQENGYIYCTLRNARLL